MSSILHTSRARILLGVQPVHLRLIIPFGFTSLAHIANLALFCKVISFLIFFIHSLSRFFFCTKQAKIKKCKNRMKHYHCTTLFILNIQRSPENNTYLFHYQINYLLRLISTLQILLKHSIILSFV